MPTFNRSWRLGGMTVATIIVVGTVIGIGANAATPDSVSGQPPSCDGYSSAAAQAATRVDSAAHSDPAISYDIEQDVAVVTAGQDQWVLDGSDARCRANPEAARLLDRERAIARDSFAQACPDMRAAIAEGRTRDRGQAVNLDGARQYVRDFCE